MLIHWIGHWEHDNVYFSAHVAGRDYRVAARVFKRGWLKHEVRLYGVGNDVEKCKTFWFGKEIAKAIAESWIRDFCLKKEWGELWE